MVRPKASAFLAYADYAYQFRDSKESQARIKAAPPFAGCIPYMADMWKEHLNAYGLLSSMTFSELAMLCEFHVLSGV
jgi:hypothetical protein